MQRYDSRWVADHLGLHHHYLLARIDHYAARDYYLAQQITEDTYPDTLGRPRRCVAITAEGIHYLAQAMHINNPIRERLMRVAGTKFANDLAGAPSPTHQITEAIRNFCDELGISFAKEVVIPKSPWDVGHYRVDIVCGDKIAIEIDEDYHKYRPHLDWAKSAAIIGAGYLPYRVDASANIGAILAKLAYLLHSDIEEAIRCGDGI